MVMAHTQIPLLQKFSFKNAQSKWKKAEETMQPTGGKREVKIKAATSHTVPT